MKRRLFTLAAAASLVLCVGTAALWVRSHFVGEVFMGSYFEDEGEWTYWVQRAVTTGGGSVRFNWVSQSGPRDRYRQSITRLTKGVFSQYARAEPTMPDSKFGPSERSFLGFSYGHHAVFDPPRVRPRAEGYVLTVPLWFPVAGFATLPLIWLANWRRLRRRVHEGRCPACGYDLRATPDRCPECGAVPAAPAAR